jgi:integrase
LCIFAADTGIDLFNLPDLATVEARTESYIMRHTRDLAPKTLNIVFSAVKTWCLAEGLVRNRKMFKEIRFDRTSRQTDAMTERPLENETIKQLFNVSDAQEKVLLGLYGLCGMRPSLLPQLKVSNFLNHDAEIVNGKLKFNSKNPFLIVPREYDGNKANITFFVIIPSKVAEYIEHTVNKANDRVTPETLLLSKYATEVAIYKKIKLMFRDVGFSGRPYLLRSFADNLLDQTLGHADEDLKERMLGHKGKISAVYQFHGLTDEIKKEYLAKYQKVENWINERIFGTVSTEQKTQAELLSAYATNIGVPAEKVAALMKELFDTPLSFEDFQKRLTAATNDALETRMTTKFETMFREMNHKYNGKQTKKRAKK